MPHTRWIQPKQTARLCDHCHSRQRASKCTNIAFKFPSQSYTSQPDIWFANKRASSESLNGSGQAGGRRPRRKLPVRLTSSFSPPGGYTHVMPQAFTYGTIITSVRNSICSASGGCSADIFGFGLFGSETSQTTVTVGGSPAADSVSELFQCIGRVPLSPAILTVTVPKGIRGPG